MGLLTQAVAGGLEAGANTYAGLMVDKIKGDRQAAHQSERDQAQAVREQSLAEFRQNLHDTSAKAAEQRARENTINPDYVNTSGAPVTQEAALISARNGSGDLITKKANEAADERTRSQDIGIALEPIIKDFKWDTRNPQQSAVEYMQKLRTTGELSEPEVLAEVQRMLAAKTPKGTKYEVKTIGVGGGLEQSFIVNLDDPKEKPVPLGKPSVKFAPHAPDKPDKEGPKLRSIKSADGIRTFNMSNPTERKQFEGWISTGKGVEFFGSEIVSEDEERKVEQKISASGLVAPSAGPSPQNRKPLSSF